MAMSIFTVMAPFSGEVSYRQNVPCLHHARDYTFQTAPSSKRLRRTGLLPKLPQMSRKVEDY